jgi:predicted methyltransferase
MKGNLLIFKFWVLLVCISSTTNGQIGSGGFIPDLQKMKVSFSPEQDIYQIKPGDSIAEIGFGTGWMTAYMMMQYDSLTIYAEDIDRGACKHLPEVIDQYLTLRNRPQTNRIQIVKGKKKASELDVEIANKVIIRETFHHFRKPQSMMQDIYKITKRDGLVFIYELSTDITRFDKRDKTTRYAPDDLIRLVESAGFKFEREHHLIGNPGNVPPWWEVPKEHVFPRTVFVFRK